MSQRFYNPAPQFFYQGTNQPLTGGLMYFYVHGSTLTPKDTYSDNGLSVPNSNPVVLSSSGVLPNVFLSGSYRVILKDKDGVQQWDRDSINSVADLVGNTWDSTLAYGMGATNIVYASDGVYYISIQPNNLGHDPSAGANPLWWKNAFDYFADSQTLVAPGFIAVGDAAAGLTGLDLSAKGSIIAGDGTTAPQALAVGTNNYVLTADSAQALGVKWAATSLSGTVLLATLTPTAAAAVDALSTFSSTYDNYLIIGDGIFPAASTSLQMRFANAGVVDASSNYGCSANVAGTTSTGVTIIQVTSSANVYNATGGLNFAFTVQNVNSSAALKVTIGSAVYQSAAAPTYNVDGVNGIYGSASLVSGVRFLWASGGNFAATGKIRIYGLLN